DLHSFPTRRSSDLLTKNITVKAAPTYYYYNGHGADLAAGSPELPGFNGTYVGQGSTNGVLGGSAAWRGYAGVAYDGFAANQTGIRDLEIIEVPLEANYKTKYADYRLFGD